MHYPLVLYNAADIDNRIQQGVPNMTAEELWGESGLTGEYEAWAFGGAPDKLTGLV